MDRSLDEIIGERPVRLCAILIPTPPDIFYREADWVPVPTTTREAISDDHLHHAHHVGTNFRETASKR